MKYTKEEFLVGWEHISCVDLPYLEDFSTKFWSCLDWTSRLLLVHHTHILYGVGQGESDIPKY